MNMEKNTDKKLFYALIAVIVAMMMLIGMTLWSAVDQADRANVAEHNLMVMQDSVKELTLKNGEHLATINSYILEKEELDKYLGYKDDEIAELEKKVGKLTYIANITPTIQYDSIVIHDTLQYSNGHWKGSVIYKDDWTNLIGGIDIGDQNGFITSYDMTLDSLTIKCPLDVGLTKDYQIWVKSRNPYINITDLNGAVLSKQQVKPKTYWSIALQAGFGAQYGLVHKTFDVGPYFGVGIGFGWDF